MLCAVCCVLCALCSVLYAVCCVLCAVLCALCSVLYALCSLNTKQAVSWTGRYRASEWQQGKDSEQIGCGGGSITRSRIDDGSKKDGTDAFFLFFGKKLKFGKVPSLLFLGPQKSLFGK
jgi:hypothetical protein